MMPTVEELHDKLIVDFQQTQNENVKLLLRIVFLENALTAIRDHEDHYPYKTEVAKLVDRVMPIKDKSKLRLECAKSLCHDLMKRKKRK